MKLLKALNFVLYSQNFMLLCVFCGLNGDYVLKVDQFVRGWRRESHVEEMFVW